MSIEVTDLCFSYKKGTPVLNHLTFTLPDKGFVCLLGPNGVGKSTLFKCMLGLLDGYTGTITINGNDISKMSKQSLARTIAYIPQSSAPVFNYTVSDVVLMGTTSMVSAFSSPGEKERKYVEDALSIVGIPQLKNRMFMNLSGGERQLVLVARALAQQAKILFMDEPTANLDYGNQIRVLEQVKRLSAQGYTVIQSTHNPEQAFLFADDVLAIKGGALAAHGSPREVLDAEMVYSLYGVRSLVESVQNDKYRVCIPLSALEEAEK